MIRSITPTPTIRFVLPPCIHLLGCPADQPEHLFGLDSNGRDLFSRVVYATRVSLFIGLATVTFAHCHRHHHRRAVRLYRRLDR